jgi:hypothetical protein
VLRQLVARRQRPTHTHAHTLSALFDTTLSLSLFLSLSLLVGPKGADELRLHAAQGVGEAYPKEGMEARSGTNLMALDVW